MKGFARLFTVVIAFVIVFTLFPMQAEAATVKLNKTKTTIYVGKSETLQMKGTSKKVSWSGSNKKIAKVNKKGKVTAKKEGVATITLNGKNGKSYTCQVTVIPMVAPTWTGGEITLKNIGVTIPTLDKFKAK